MFETKKKLILASSIICLVLAVVVTLLSIVVGLDVNFMVNYMRSFGFYVSSNYNFILLMALIITIPIYLIAGILLMIVAVSKTPEEFNKKRSVFIAGAVFTILSGIVSIQSILIYIVIGMRDVPTFTEEGKELYKKDNGVPVYQQQYNKAVQQNQQTQPQANKEDFEKKIEALRKLRDSGTITDEEFKSLLSKLL